MLEIAVHLKSWFEQYAFKILHMIKLFLEQSNMSDVISYSLYPFLVNWFNIPSVFTGKYSVWVVLIMLLVPSLLGSAILKMLFLLL